jgi:AraC family transcriptional regulator
MRPQSAAAWPPADVSVTAMHRKPGSLLLPPAHDHRVIVHLSPATRTFCRETGLPFLRKAGEIDLVPAGVTGGFDTESACESLEIRLAPRMFDRVAAELGRAGGAPQFETRHCLRNDRIVHLARALEGDLRADSPSGPLYAGSIGVALAIQLLGLTDDQPRRLTRLSTNQLNRVLAYIDAHLDRPLTLEILSREAGASSSHLRTWFKAAMGVTVHRYVLRRRVERARLLLLRGDLRPSEIALEVGFSHQSHLTRWMRRELGCTPGMLRRTSST